MSYLTVVVEPLVPLNKDEISIWIFDLTRYESHQKTCWQQLSQEEKQKADSFIFAKDRLNYVLCHGLLKTIICRYLKTPHLKLDVNRYGKPFLQSEPQLHFNLSHSKHFACMAFASHPVGVDIEYIRKIDLIENILSKSERQLINSLPADQQLAAFFQTWTTKEAYLKSLGIGLLIPLDEIETADLPSKGWSILPLTFSDQFRGTVAIRATPIRQISYLNPELFPSQTGG